MGLSSAWREAESRFLHRSDVSGVPRLRIACYHRCYHRVSPKPGNTGFSRVPRAPIDARAARTRARRRRGRRTPLGFFTLLGVFRSVAPPAGRVQPARASTLDAPQLVDPGLPLVPRLTKRRHVASKSRSSLLPAQRPLFLVPASCRTRGQPHGVAFVSRPRTDNRNGSRKCSTPSSYASPTATLPTRPRRNLQRRSGDRAPRSCSPRRSGSACSTRTVTRSPSNQSTSSRPRTSSRGTHAKGAADHGTLVCDVVRAESDA